MCVDWTCTLQALRRYVLKLFFSPRGLHDHIKWLVCKHGSILTSIHRISGISSFQYVRVGWSMCVAHISLFHLGRGSTCVRFCEPSSNYTHRCVGDTRCICLRAEHPIIVYTYLVTDFGIVGQLVWSLSVGFVLIYNPWFSSERWFALQVEVLFNAFTALIVQWLVWDLNSIVRTNRYCFQLLYHACLYMCV
jgi:hypothetical protein